MDLLSLAAVVGLVFVGKRNSDAKEVPPEMEAATMPQQPITSLETDLRAFRRSQDPTYDETIMTPDIGRGFSGDWRLRPKEITGNLGDAWKKDGHRFPFGQPVYDLTARETTSNKMNNLNPGEKLNVGRGLGLGLSDD